MRKGTGIRKAETRRGGREAGAAESNAGLDYILECTSSLKLVDSVPAWECRRDYMVERSVRRGAGSIPAAEAARAAGAKLGLGILVPGILFRREGALSGRENAEGTTCASGANPGGTARAGP